MNITETLWIYFACNDSHLGLSVTLYLSGMHASGFRTYCYYKCLEQDAQLSQRDRAAGCVIVFAKSRRLEVELGDNILLIL